MKPATGLLTYPAKLFQHGGAAGLSPPVLDFSVSINPLGPPASALTAIREALPGIARYPDSDCVQLRVKLAGVHQVEPAQVIAGNGSNELIHLIARVFRPARVAIAEPTYTEYLRASLAVGARVDHWIAKPPAFQPAPFEPGDAQLVWLCNPNNPTGQFWPAARETAAWIAGHPATLFVVDEAFLPFVSVDATLSLVGWTARLPNLIVLRSMTKFWAIPGLRLGYAVAHPDLIARLRAGQEPWSVNVLAQAAGLAILDDHDFAARTHAWLAETLPSFQVELWECQPHLDLLPSAINFFLVDLPEPTAPAVASRLADRGIRVREASNFIGLDDHYLRIGFRTEAENCRLVEELKDVLRSGGTHKLDACAT